MDYCVTEPLVGLAGCRKHQGRNTLLLQHDLLCSYNFITTDFVQ